jgi:hypothetical protein
MHTLYLHVGRIWSHIIATEKCRERTSACQRINFDNICKIIQTLDGFSRHLETYYNKVVKTTQEGRFIKKLINILFFQKNPDKSGIISSMMVHCPLHYKMYRNLNKRENPILTSL